MDSDRRQLCDSVTAPMPTTLPSLNRETVRKTVQEMLRRFVDAVVRNQIDQIKMHRLLLQVSYSAKAQVKRQPSSPTGKADWVLPVSTLLARIDPMATLSITHLSKATRRRLENDALSVASYPNKYGGFVYVGGTAADMPKEADLFTIAKVAQLANLVWLKFDRDAPVVEGLPVFMD